MKEIYIDIRTWYERSKKRFSNKDLITLEDLLNDYEELIYEKEYLEEEIEDLKQDIAENYRPIPYAEQVGISDRDFI